MWSFVWLVLNGTDGSPKHTIPACDTDLAKGGGGKIVLSVRGTVSKIEISTSFRRSKEPSIVD